MKDQLAITFELLHLVGHFFPNNVLAEHAFFLAEISSDLFLQVFACYFCVQAISFAPEFVFDLIQSLSKLLNCINLMILICQFYLWLANIPIHPRFLPMQFEGRVHKQHLTFIRVYSNDVEIGFFVELNNFLL